MDYEKMSVNAIVCWDVKRNNNKLQKTCIFVILTAANKILAKKVQAIINAIGAFYAPYADMLQMTMSTIGKFCPAPLWNLMMKKMILVLWTQAQWKWKIIH